MTNLEFSSEMTVKLVDYMAADVHVVQAAQVSSKGERDIEELVRLYEEGKINLERFITALMKGRHGSPFEHTAFKMFVEAPLFVFREWQRHRISSFNEMSGRYTEMIPKFYIAAEDRPIVMSENGTKMKPDMVLASAHVHRRHIQRKMRTAEVAWQSYQADLEDGIVNEMARTDLPLHLYSQMYWTVNARSLMNFLSLRVQSDDSLVRSYPQYEIDVAAQKVEDFFKEKMPITHAAFVKNGRVAP